MAMKLASGASEMGTLERVVVVPGAGVMTTSGAVMTSPGERVWPPGMTTPALEGKGENPLGNAAGGAGAIVGDPGLGFGGTLSLPAVGSGWGAGRGGRNGLRIWLMMGGRGLTADCALPGVGEGAGRGLSPLPGFLVGFAVGLGLPSLLGLFEGLAVGLGSGSDALPLLVGSTRGSIFGGAVYAVSRMDVAVMYVDGIVNGAEPVKPVESIRRNSLLSASEPQPCERCSTQTVGATLRRSALSLIRLDRCSLTKQSR